ncbi:MAG: hypothetical protein ACOYO1_11135 [Bacteroidales bacterium]
MGKGIFAKCVSHTKKNKMDIKIENIIKALDQELVITGKPFLTLAHATKLLYANKILTQKDINENKLKKLLIQDKIPNASQTDHKPKQWRIFPSKLIVTDNVKSINKRKIEAEVISNPIPISNYNRNIIKTVEVEKGYSASKGTAYVFLIIGIVLCFTGIGALIGIPLILAGIALPFLNIGNSKIKGKCPYCNYDVYSFKYEPGVTCPSCRQRILIRHGNYIKFQL